MNESRTPEPFRNIEPQVRNDCRACRRKLILGLAVLALAAAGGRAAPPPRAPWPGLWGPDRNARIAAPLRLAPSVQVKEIWRRAIGKGFSEVAVAGGRGYTMFSDGETDHLTAFDVATGRETWRARLEAT